MTLRHRIAMMSPRRYARAARRAAVLAVELAESLGRDVRPEVRALAETSEDDIARRRVAAHPDPRIGVVAEYIWTETTAGQRLTEAEACELAAAAVHGLEDCGYEIEQPLPPTRINRNHTLWAVQPIVGTELRHIEFGDSETSARMYLSDCARVSENYSADLVRADVRWGVVASTPRKDTPPCLT